ncbi:hypothetical protein [Methylorubrum extorquens]|uniref:hypothetical protein n=1 Tax=Methylorubrum extorquens TaxID=408 RepID=UPI0012DB415F|nr:hypothetical protein [Methylorubrum extorquens]
MASKTKRVDAVPVGRLFLALDNPRFEPVEAESKAIEELCTKENVYPLARDIVKYGINPLENLALVPVNRSDPDRPSTNYYVAEGNRRVCAIKLLNDPDLAPPKLRKSFEKLAADWSPIKTVPGMVFRDDAALKLWIERLHNGEQGGAGRKNWNADQKSRHDGDSKNRPALALLDYAEKEKMILPAERARKITTVQRFLSNVIFREALGLDQSNDEDVSRNRPKSEFDIVAKKFMGDLVVGKDVNSRMNQDAIISYARGLNTLSGVSAKRIPAESLSSSRASSTKKRPLKAPKKPEKLRHIQYESEIASALAGYGNEKLKSLYHSIVYVDLEDHTPLITVGVWSFFETLTGCCGRNEGTSIDSYLSNNRLGQYKLAGDIKACRAALERIRDYGNTTKHHKVAASFNGDQLNNDMVTLKDVILSCIAEASKLTS